MRENVIRNDSLREWLGERKKLSRCGSFLIQNGFERGFRDDPCVKCEFRPIQLLFNLGFCHTVEFQRPNANLSNFEWIKDIHGHGVSPLVCQVPAYSHLESLEGLSYIDRLTIVIVKSIYPVLRSAHSSTLAIWGVHELRNFCPDGRNIPGLPFDCWLLISSNFFSAF